MDTDDNEASEPSSSHICENSSDGCNEDYLNPDETSSLNIDSSEVFEHLDKSNEDSHSSDVENDHHQSNYYTLKKYSYQGKDIESNIVEQSLMPAGDDFLAPNSEHDQVMDEIELDGSQPGCSSSSSSANNSYFNYLDNENNQSGSEVLLGEINQPEINLAQSSDSVATTSKQADSNCLERSKGKGKKVIFKVKKLSQPLEIQADVEEGIAGLEPLNLDGIVQSSNRYSLFSKSGSKPILSTFQLGKSSYTYDSDSSIDDIDIIESQPSQTSSPHSRNVIPSVSCFLNDDESFMVASSSEGLGPMNDILQMQSSTAPGDSCLVSSSTGQLDSLPPTPLNFQENDVSHSSAESSPVHPLVLDSTVDSTSGQNIASPYSGVSDDEGEVATLDDNINLSNSKMEERGEISTSDPHIPVLEIDECDENVANLENNLAHGKNESQFIGEYFSIDCINPQSLVSELKDTNDVKASVFIPSTSAYIPESLEIPGTSGMSDSSSKEFFALPKETYDIPNETNNSLGPGPGSVSVDFEVDTSMGAGRLMELDLAAMDVESSDVVASSASFDDEFPSGTEENSLGHSVNNFQSASTLTQLNQHYILDIGESSLSNSEESMPESTSGIDHSSIQLDVTECIEAVSDTDEESPNFQASLELGLGPQQLRDFSGSQCEPQSLVPPPHLMEEGNQIEASSSNSGTIELVECSQSINTGRIEDPISTSFPSCAELPNEVMPNINHCSADNSSSMTEFRNVIQRNNKDINSAENEACHIEDDNIAFHGSKLKDINVFVKPVLSFQKTTYSWDNSLEKKSSNISNSNYESDMGALHRLNLSHLDSFDSLFQAPKNQNKTTPLASSSQDSPNNFKVSSGNIVSNDHFDASNDNIPVNIHSLFGKKLNKLMKPTSWRLDNGDKSQLDGEIDLKNGPISPPKIFESLFNKTSYNSKGGNCVKDESQSVSDDLTRCSYLNEGNVSCSKLSNLDLTNTSNEDVYNEIGISQSEEELNDEVPNSLFFEHSTTPFIISVDATDQSPDDCQIDVPSISSAINKVSPREESGFWCSDCEKFLKAKCSTHRVQTIMDKPILSRAFASLPAQYLFIKQDSDENDISLGVFARKTIPKRTQFGPLEGIFCHEPSFHAGSLSFKSTQNMIVGFIDISDEGTSNWMRFVRPAKSYLKMNCIVIEEDDLIYFHTNTNIQPKSELRVGYSNQYAMKYGLQALTPSKEEQKILKLLKKTWSCSKCDDCFETSTELQNHVITHNKKKFGKKPIERSRIKKLKLNEESPLNLSHPKKIKTDDKSSNENINEGKVVKLNPTKKDIAVYECLQCSLCFNNEELLKYHMWGHSAKPTSSTSECDNLVENNNSEKENEDHEEGEKRTCPSCLMIFLSKQEFCEHVKKHSYVMPSKSKNKQNPFKCDFCYKSFCSQERLNNHSEVHKNESEKPFPCYHCMRRFCTKSALGSHIILHNEGLLDVKVYECPICREKLLTVNELRVHVKKHCVDGVYTCPTCLKKFPFYFQIRRHIRSYHTDLTFTCPDCGKEMPSWQKLNIHMAIHSNKREFECPVCLKTFNRKDKMKEHLKRIHTHKKEPKERISPSQKFVPKTNPNDYKKFMYKCDQCLLGFKRRGMFVNHFSKRHPDIPISSIPELNQPILRTCRTYSCNYCGKTYGSVTKRKLHIFKNHPGDELNPSKSQEDLTNIKPVTMRTYAASCPWCPRQYMTKAKLLQHQRNHHSRLVQMNKDKKNTDKHAPQLSEIQSPSENAESSNSISLVPQEEASGPNYGGDIICRYKLSKEERVGETSQQVINLEVSYCKGKNTEDEQQNIQPMQISEPVLVNVSNAPILVKSSLTSQEETQPYVVLTPDGGDSYTLSFKPGNMIDNFSLLSTKVNKQIIDAPCNGDLALAGPSQVQSLPLDMRSSRSRNSHIIEGSSTQIIVSSDSPMEEVSQFSLDIGSIKNDSCVLAQVGTDLVMCHPYLSFSTTNH